MSTLTVPLIPPSVNHYAKHTRQGKHYVTPEAKAFKDAVAIFNRGNFTQGKTFYVTIAVILGAGDSGDVDNFPKLVLDGLKDCGAFRDKKGKLLSDGQVRKLTVIVDPDERPEQGRTEIEYGTL